MDEKTQIVIHDWQMFIAAMVVFGIGFLVGKFDSKAKNAGK